MKVLFERYLNSTFIMLLLILLLGLFLRTYKLEIFYPFAHDQDLSAWIAKDIVVDHHIRLIGQETSVLGIFVGPLFYYLVAASFAIFKMNPLSGAIVTTIIGLCTNLSIFWVFGKLFNRNVGLIGCFIYAVSPAAIFGDRWLVPTQPTILWAVWFMYVLFCILKGNYQIMIPLSILIGLIWHIHIALLPLLMLVPIAFLLSDKKKVQIKSKTILISLLTLIVFLTPFIIFEARHNGLQIRSFITATQANKDSYTGISRLFKVINSSGRALVGSFVLSGNVYLLSQSFLVLVQLILLLALVYLRRLKILENGQVVIFIFWYLIVDLGQFFSKKPISEYYFSNLVIILFLVIALFINRLNDVFKKFHPIYLLMIIFTAASLIRMINMSEEASGFSPKRQAIEYIRNDFLTKGYPCVGINHIEPKQNVISGYRYLFWYYGITVIKPSNDIPVYSIVNPWTISAKEVNMKFDDIGVILPAVKKIDPKVCVESDRQLLPLWGFNN